MRVAVETLDLSDDTLKSIRRAQNQTGKATRAEAKVFLQNRINHLLNSLVQEYPPNKRPVSSGV